MMTRRRYHGPTAITRDGIAIGASCRECAREIGSPDPVAPGRHMAVVHEHHVHELAALGWIVIRYAHEPPDVVCPHYHASHWQG